jgi:ligand-binding sensor domain-containing protein
VNPGRFVWLASALALAPPSLALDRDKLISQFTHTSWSAKDGIPGPVRAIAQIPDGYLWLGTEAGLYRFDGLCFVPIESSNGAGPNEHSKAVWSLCAARDGGLWIGFGSGGVGKLQNGRFIHYPSEEGAPAGGVLSIAEDSTGVISAGGPYAFGRFENGAWRKVGKEMGYPAPGAQALLVDAKGALWAATDGGKLGLTKDPVRSNTIVRLAPHAKSFASTGEAVGMVWNMAEGPDGHVWLAETSARRLRQIGTPSSSDVDAGGEPMSVGFGEESVWVGLIEGGVRRSINDQEPRRKAPDSFYPTDGLSGGLIYSSFKDREVWTEC